MTKAQRLYQELTQTADAYDQAAEETNLPGERLFNRSCAAAYRHAARRTRIILCIPIVIDGDKISITVAKP